MYDELKQKGFRGAAAAERLVRGFGGTQPSLAPSDLSSIRNFLLPFFDVYLGAAVHATPVVEALRTAVPDANIVAAASGVGWQVFQHHPGLNRIEQVPDPQRDFWGAVRGLRGIVKSFRGEPWCALTTAWNQRSRVALALMMSGNGVRAGFSVAPALLHRYIDPRCGGSQIEKNLSTLALLGHSASQILEPRVYFSEAEARYAAELLRGDQQSPIVLLITRTSGGQPTAWPDERFLSVARHLVREWNCRILLPGTERDADALQRLASEIGPSAVSLAGKTTIPGLAAVCALSDLAISVDTGALHVARSQKLPVVVIAPAWQDSIEWMPLGQDSARILKGDWFPPPPPANYAIEEVTVKQVTAAADELLEQFPPGYESRQGRIKRSEVIAPKIKQAAETWPGRISVSPG